MHAEIKSKSFQVANKWQDLSPNVSEYAISDSIGALEAIAESVPERKDGVFSAPADLGVRQMAKDRLDPMFKALGDVMESLRSDGVVNEIGVGRAGIFQGGYAMPSHDEKRMMSPDGSMNDIGRSLAINGGGYVFLNIGDGDANMGLHQYVTELDSRARKERKRGTIDDMPDYAIIVWDNKALYNVTASENRKIGGAVSGYSSGFEWGKIGDLYTSGEVQSGRADDAPTMKRALSDWSADPNRKKILLLHANLPEGGDLPPIIATPKVIE